MNTSTAAQSSPSPSDFVSASSAAAFGLVAEARSLDRGIGAFNVVLLEHAEAIVTGAERAGLPVILQISQNAAKYHGSFRPIAAASLAIARSCSVPAIVHLDHAENVDLVHAAVDLGVQSVMFDGSALPYVENVATTRAVVEYCHAHDVLVEAELGEVGGKDGVHAPGVRTRPHEAAAFVAATGVDALAVAVGTSHAMTSRVATIDRALVTQIKGAVPVPLVLHGSSGLSDDELVAAVRAGMTKINISTHLNGLFTAAVRNVLAADAAAVDPRKYVRPAREAVAVEVERLLVLLAR